MAATRLTLLGFSHRKGNRRYYDRFRCSCGGETVVRRDLARSGHTVSCGCYSRTKAITHGLYKSRAYKAWSHMIDRCTKPCVKGYKDYGGRGITVCDRWKDVRAFVADMGEPPPGLKLERIDNDGNYEPANCRWATHTEQMRNRTISHFVTFNGARRTLAEWEEVTGIQQTTIRRRLSRYGWSVERALTIPPKLGGNHGR